jgi:polysaccharide export outer membrane protein
MNSMNKQKVFTASAILPVVILMMINSCVSGSNVIDYNTSKATSIDLSHIEEVTTDRRSASEINAELTSLNKLEFEKYRININDVFNIFIDADPNFNTLQAIVKSDGYITVKRLGEVKVAGLTMEEASDLINTGFKKFFKISPMLSIIPVSIKNPRVNILGEVRNPGSYRIEGNMRILDAISLAGGIADVTLQDEKIEVASLENAYIYRRDRILPVDFVQLIEHGNPMHNILLQDQDYIFIPSLIKQQVYIMGEVNSPGKYMIGSDMSLTKLLAVSQGLKETASRNAYVFRGNLKNPSVFKINLNSILKQGGADFPLKYDDIVYMPKNAITEYNMVINSILPTLNMLNSTTTTWTNVDTIANTLKTYSGN